MLDLFREAYENPEAEVERALAEGRKPIRTLGYDAPRGLLIKAGFQPIRLVAPPLVATPRADAIMGAAAMRTRGKRLLEALLDPVHPQVPVLITAADDEQPQIFAALRELARLGEKVPQHVHFLDRLHLDRASSRAYTTRRLGQLDEWLNSVRVERSRDTDHGISTLLDANGRVEALAKQAELLGHLSDLRASSRVYGTAVLQVIGAAAILPTDEYTAALEPLIAALADNPVLPGKRVFVCGSPHESPALYRAIEAAGALIVGEDQAWGSPFAEPDRQPPRIADPAEVGQRIAAQAAALGAELVLHLTIGGDEAAPWDIASIKRGLPGMRFAALRSAAEPDEALARKLAAALAGEPDAPPAPEPPPPRVDPTKPTAAQQTRSRKSLTSVADFNAYQREWFTSIRQRVTDGAPFAVVNANAPQEILRALDIPFVVNQWWASIVAAKQQTRRYLGLLRERDYPPDVEAYSAQGLAAAFEDDPENAPWGGLPRPDILHAVASSDATLKMFEHWARETGADCYVYERTYDPRPDLFQDWWARVPEHWDEALEEERLDLMVAELGEVIARLETKTGCTFSPERFAEVMDLVNEQELYFRKTRDLIARTIPAPIGVVDSMPATMVPQWHRGTVWARDAAKAFYEEVKQRVDAGQAAVPNERIRLMFVGRGLWSEMGFYQRWEESHGAVFVWSMYLALAADGYIRETSGGRDPLRALASRFITMGDELRMPTWAGPWNVQQADTHNIDAVVALSDADPFVVRALRAAGYPVLELVADNFNRESEDGAAIDAQITAFIEGPASERAQARGETMHVGA
jgi:benzoyl-CoA reductase/2-hydroxyglutaryl-CoA dehydratase subunit BcrC/BadD/HgdB